jgi:hypothetical protein
MSGDEIDALHYCAADSYNDGFCRHGGICSARECYYYRHKWPTPEQYKAEYGEEWPDGNATYHRAHRNFPGWTTWWYEQWERDTYEDIVCACTPWGKPPDDWRPDDAAADAPERGQ